MEQIEIIKPDDWHVHFRDNDILKAVVPILFIKFYYIDQLYLSNQQFLVLFFSRA